ncbi:MAG: immunoglobulin domain-containing protein [Verrucomicrobia bacterium]|nr:immunoglobulin domain-containing protein [Verrucomicrobiota bacterium]
MKTSSLEVNGWVFQVSHQVFQRFTFLPLLLLVAVQAFGQVPSLLWSTNIGATLFAVDNQTNSYANVGGSVIVINPNGVPVSTNVICPKPGVARRDASGNFYFAGNFDGTQNFGGITLVGGWTNWPSAGQWTPGYPTHFITKYTSNGTLVWAKSFGSQAFHGNNLTDIFMDSTGGVFLGHIGQGVSGSPPFLARFDSSGVFQWDNGYAVFTIGTAIKIGGEANSNVCVVVFDTLGVRAQRRNFAGAGTSTSTDAFFPMSFSSEDAANANPVIDNQGQFFVAGRTNGQQLIAKFGTNGFLIWAIANTNAEQWSLARDASECFYFASASNVLTKYDANGSTLWSANYQKKAVKMVVGAAEIRFVGFSDGSIARLSADSTPQPPFVISGPQNQIVSLGDNATFSANVGGSPTLYYQWRKNSTNLVGSTLTNHTITGVTSNHVGSYDVVVTNVYGSVTSTPPASLLIAPSLLSPFTGTIGVWGQQATLSVSAWGSGTLTYQWYKAGQLVSGETNSTLVFPSLQITNAGLYSVVVTSQYGVVTNTPAALVVNPANVSLGLYAGVIIDGTAGYTYGIEYTTNLQNAIWQSLTNVTLTQPVEIWVDTSVNVPTAPKRFYRVTSQ